MRFHTLQIFASAGAVAFSSIILASCSGVNVVPTSSMDASGQPTSNSPYVRTEPDGTVIRIHPLPQIRAMYPLVSGANMIYHGGAVVHTSVAYAIFMRPTGTFMSALYETAIEDFFEDVGGTAQYNILTQYYDTKGPILNQATLGGVWTDTRAYPAGFASGGTGDADLHKEVLKAIAVNHWPNGGVQPIFFIFTASSAPDDSWAACAYHASFGLNGRNYLYAIVPYQHDYGAQGCGTPTNVWPNDRDADQTIDTTWHEFAESVTDPITTGNGAWWNNGGEVGDVCQTNYAPRRSDGSNVTDGDSRFITQEIWSNFNSRCYQQQATR